MANVNRIIARTVRFHKEKNVTSVALVTTSYKITKRVAKTVLNHLVWSAKIRKFVSNAPQDTLLEKSKT